MYIMKSNIKYLYVEGSLLLEQAGPVEDVQLLGQAAGVVRDHTQEGLQQRELWGQLGHRDDAEVPRLLRHNTTQHPCFKSQLQLYSTIPCQKVHRIPENCKTIGSRLFCLCQFIVDIFVNSQ